MRKKISVPVRCDFWVNQKTYRWASKRWAKHNLRIDMYLSDNTILVTRPGYSFNPNYKRRIKISAELAEKEMKAWYEDFRLGRAVKKWMGK